MVRSGAHRTALFPASRSSGRGDLAMHRILPEFAKAGWILYRQRGLSVLSWERLPAARRADVRQSSRSWETQAT